MFDPNRICLGCMEELENGAVVCPKCGWNNAANNNVSHQLLAGSVLLGKYLVGRVLGEGGFGITYIGWDLILERKVAIKEFYPQGIVNRELTHRSTVVSCVGKEEFIEKEKEGFIKEAKTMAKLGNIPGIVTMHDVFAQNGTVYIVMDYVKGKTLKAYVKENGNRLPVQQVISLLEPIFKALQNVHEKGLIHRDISPDNIMLRPDGTAVLLDFGAARQMSVAGERSLTVNLKHGYAPMEQYQTRGVQGPWTDVYALSATIYRLITGKVPPSAADRIIEDDLPLPSTLGADILPWQEKALMHGLAVRTADRILNVSELWEGLTTDPAAEPARVQSPENPGEENESGETKDLFVEQHNEKDMPIEPAKEIKKQAKEDAVNQAEECEKPSDAVNEEKKGKEVAKQPEKKRKGKNTKFLVIISAILTVLLLMLIFEPSIDAFSIKKESNYKKGINLFENREYGGAYEYLSKARGYKDVEKYIKEIDIEYNEAKSLYKRGYFNEARRKFEELHDYRNANNLFLECQRGVAYYYLEEMEPEMAIWEFEKLEHVDRVIDFLDSVRLKLQNAESQQGKYSVIEYEYLRANRCFDEYSDLEKENLKGAIYHIATGAMKREEYIFSRKLFVMLDGYSDSANKIENIDATIIKYINEHQKADDYLTYQYLMRILTFDWEYREWVEKIKDSLYGKFVNFGGNENMVWTLAKDGTLLINGVGTILYVSLSSDEKDATKKIVICEGIEKIDTASLYGFDKIESVEIPSTVEYIGANAFGFSSSSSDYMISKIKISKDNKYYTVVNGKLVKIGD